MATQKPLVIVNGTVQEMASTDAVTAAMTLKNKVLNQSGATMPIGSAVYVSSANGDNPVVSLAQANAESTSSKTVGLLETSLATGEIGNVIEDGLIIGLDTSTATIGDPVWLSPTTAGDLVYGVANKPVAPNHMVFIGKVVRVHANQGSIFVNVQNGFEVDELHDVLLTNPADGDCLIYDSASGLWKNKKPASRILNLSANSATPSINANLYDVVNITSQSAAITGVAVTGTPVANQRLIISITGTTSIAITWGSSFESSTVVLPTTTSGTARLDVGFFYNSTNSKWRCVAVA